MIFWDKSSKVPLRVILIVPFVIQIVLMVGLVGYISFRNGQQAVNNVASQLRSELTDRIEKHLHTFLAIPHQINQLNVGAIHQGLLAVDDQSALESYFWEQIQVFDSVTSIYFGNTEGGLVDAGREGFRGPLYVIVTDDFTSGPFRKYATDSQGNRAELLTTIPDFDARTRSWYSDAVRRSRATWSDIYILFTGHDMAISASRPVYDEQQNLLGVVANDIFISHIGDFLESLKFGETGSAFIIERSGLLVASSMGGKLFTDSNGDEIQRRLYASESEIPGIRYAAEFLSEQFGDYNQITGELQFEFEIDGQRQFLQVAPVQDKYGIDWLVVVVIPESDFMAQIRINNRITAFLIIISLVVAIIIGIITTRWVTMPILHLDASTQALSKGDWEQEIGVVWIREIDELAQSFRDMVRQLRQTLESLTAEISERKQAEAALLQSHRRLEETLAKLKDAQEQMRRQERLAAVGQLASGIAHDFRNLLTTIILYANMTLLKPELSPELAPNIETIISESKKAADLVQQILDFSSRSMLRVQAFDLENLIRDMLGMLRRTIPEHVTLSLHADPGNKYIIHADPARIQQALINLATNARDAQPNGGELHFELSCLEVGADSPPPVAEMRPGTWVCLAISDKGTGMTEEVRAHLFEPFFTTKAVGKGTGLGLAQVYGIVRQHKGYIDVAAELGQGTTFFIYLPAYEMGEEVTQLEEFPRSHSSQGETLLFVEDNDNLRYVGQSILEALGYQVLTATNGREALEVYAEAAGEIDLVITDIVMPEMGGKALVQELQRRDPGLKALGITGYAEEKITEDLDTAGFLDIIHKPFEIETLGRVIRRSLGNVRTGRWI
ncbi:MAG: response regulator [Anaerolineae bacterium]|nr:response regulator [Anaerolineae bacterium]